MTIAAVTEHIRSRRAFVDENRFLPKAIVILSLMLCDAAVFSVVDIFLRIFNAAPEFVLAYRKPVALNFSRYDVLLVIGATFVVLRYIFGDYSRRQLFLDGARATTIALLVGFVPFTIALILAKPASALLPAMIGWATLFFAIPWSRQFARRGLSRIGLWSVPAAVVGTSKSACDVYTALSSQIALGFDVQWVIATSPGCQLPPVLSHLRAVYEPLSSLATTLRALGCRQVVFVPEDATNTNLNDVIDQLIGVQIGVAIVPSIHKLPLFGLSVNYFFGKDMLLLQARNNLARLPQRLLKRTIDVVGSALLLSVLAPLLTLIAVLIKLDDGGPVFFIQKRIGSKCDDFPCWKFRTMAVDADEQMANWELTNPDLFAKYRASNFKLSDDPRMTRVGRQLRRLSLDELPQLINVLRGDMSLVGPRPLLRRELSDYGTAVAFYGRVRPGITGLWQVSGRSETTFQERVSYDEWYVKNWTLWYDIMILLRTVRVLFERHGAY